MVFEVLDYDQLNEVAAYGGFPTRYPHWRFGMDYEEMAKSYTYGLSKIYELVINNNPVYAYLMKANAPVEQKLVMAHVFGHADFFKNNLWFSKTNRRMIDTMANHATRVRSHMDRHGLEAVEDFIDACLSLENLIDAHGDFIERQEKRDRARRRDRRGRGDPGRAAAEEQGLHGALHQPARLPRAAEGEAGRAGQEEAPGPRGAAARRHAVPPRARAARALGARHPLHRAGGGRVLRAAGDDEDIERRLGQLHAQHDHDPAGPDRFRGDRLRRPSFGTLAMAPGRINPYKIGIELYREIEDRWNKGKFGKDYDECDDLEAKRRWDRKLGLGRQKIFEVRKIYNDVTFIDAFMTEEFCERLQLYVYGWDSRAGKHVIVSKDWKKVKERLLFSLTNLGQPIVHVVDANHGNRGELYLKHRFEGVPLDVEKARDTLKSLHKLWRRPVHLETMDDDRGRLLSFDGQESKSARL